MRFINTLFAGILGGICHTASADNFNTIVVKTTDGIESTIVLTENLTTTFSDTEAIFSDGSTKVAFLREQLQGFEFTYADGINHIVESQTPTRPQFDGITRRIILENLPTDCQIAVHNAQGKRIHHAIATGHHEISLANCPQGVYLVTLGRITYSITLP